MSAMFLASSNLETVSRKLLVSGCLFSHMTSSSAVFVRPTYDFEIFIGILFKFISFFWYVL